MPQNKRSFQRHGRSRVLRNEARCVVGSRASRRDNGSVCEVTCRANLAFATIHGLRDRGSAFLRLRVEFDPYSIGVKIVKRDLNLKEVLLSLLLNGR